MKSQILIVDRCGASGAQIARLSSGPYRNVTLVGLQLDNADLAMDRIDWGAIFIGIFLFDGITHAEIASKAPKLVAKLAERKESIPAIEVV